MIPITIPTIRDSEKRSRTSRGAPPGQRPLFVLRIVIPKVSDGKTEGTSQRIYPFSGVLTATEMAVNPPMLKTWEIPADALKTWVLSFSFAETDKETSPFPNDETFSPAIPTQAEAPLE